MARSTKQVIRVEGLKDLNEALLDLSRSTSGNILKRAVGAGAALIAEMAIELAPIDKGNLKREIKIGKPKIIGAGKSAFAKAMRDGATRAEAAAAARLANRAAGGSGRSAVSSAGPTKRAGQGILQEFGTAHHAAQPFMRPAWDQKGSEAALLIRETLAEGIQNAQQRAAKKAERLAAKIAAGGK